MTKALRIYVDTSVVGGCLDEEFSGPSRALLGMAEHGEAILLLSTLLLAEIEQAPEEVRSLADALLRARSEMVTPSEESRYLRDCYLHANVVGATHAEDAHHVAMATVVRADMIVSWNFRHIVHYDKIRGFNAVNMREGYGPIAIYSPLEVV